MGRARSGCSALLPAGPGAAHDRRARHRAGLRAADVVDVEAAARWRVTDDGPRPLAWSLRRLAARVTRVDLAGFAAVEAVLAVECDAPRASRRGRSDSRAASSSWRSPLARTRRARDVTRPAMLARAGRACSLAPPTRCESRCVRRERPASRAAPAQGSSPTRTSAPVEPAAVRVGLGDARATMPGPPSKSVTHTTLAPRWRTAPS